VQVLPRIYQLNGLPYNLMQNTFLVDRDGVTIVVDSGDCERVESLPEIERNAIVVSPKSAEAMVAADPR
jgi:hypothetical protein